MAGDVRMETVVGPCVILAGFVSLIIALVFGWKEELQPIVLEMLRGICQ